MRLRVIDTKSPRTGYITQLATRGQGTIIKWHNGEFEELSSGRYIMFINGFYMYCRR